MKFIKDILGYIIVIVVVLLLQRFVIAPIEVNGTSMEPTLKSGDFMIMEKISSARDNFNRGDIVVFKYEGKLLIKRIIGLPGEQVSANNGDIYINNELLQFNYLNNMPTADFSTGSFSDTAVPDDYFFVLGDNRSNSTDSRIIGYIPKESVVGKAIITFFPFRNFGFKK